LSPVRFMGGIFGREGFYAKMRILIDGYNLIRKIPELQKLDRTDMEEARENLIRELSFYRRGKRHRIEVIFDGAEAPRLGGSQGRQAGITVRFSPRGSSADRLILEALKNGEADVLVSADRELTDAAGRSEVTVISPGFFWDKVLEEMYRSFKGEEDQEAGVPGRGQGGRKLAKSRRRDQARMDKL